MSYQTFLNIASRHLPYIRKGAKKSDYCDHCIQLFVNELVGRRCSVCVCNVDFAFDVYKNCLILEGNLWHTVIVAKFWEFDKGVQTTISDIYPEFGTAWHRQCNKHMSWRDEPTRVAKALHVYLDG